MASKSVRNGRKLTDEHDKQLNASIMFGSSEMMMISFCQC